MAVQTTISRIIGENDDYNVLGSNGSTQLDLQYGGQQGFAVDLPNYLSTTKHIRRNLIIQVLSYPKFELIAGDAKGTQMKRALKAIVELHAHGWEGFKRTLTVEYAESPLGGAGEIFHTPRDVKREPTVPSMKVDELYNHAVKNLMEAWITGLIMDPDVKAAFSTFQDTNGPSNMLPDVYTMSIIAFEPDPTMKRVNRAWIVANMAPKGGGEDEGARAKTDAQDKQELTYEFTGFAASGKGAITLAQTILDAMSFTNANPNTAPAFIEEVDATVSGHRGYKSVAEGVTPTA